MKSADTFSAAVALTSVIVWPAMPNSAKMSATDRPIPVGAAGHNCDFAGQLIHDPDSEDELTFLVILTKAGFYGQGLPIGQFFQDYLKTTVCTRRPRGSAALDSSAVTSAHGA